MVAGRQKFIPYRLPAVVLSILSRFRDHDLIDQIIGAGITMMSAMSRTSFIFIERGLGFVNA